MKDSLQLKISELADLFQISPHSIRYYEKMGLLTPARDPHNNYRIYRSDSVETLMAIRELLSLGFSTEEIKDVLSDRTLETTTDLLQRELQLVNEQIVHLFEKKEELNERLTRLSSLPTTHFEEVELKKFDKRNCLMIADDNIPDEVISYQLLKFLREHNQDMDFIYSSDCYTLDIEHSNPASSYYRTQNVFFFSKSYEANANYALPAGEYLVLYYQGSLKKTKQLMPKLYDYAKKHGYKPSGNPIEICHIDDFDTDKEEEYLIEIELPVC